MVDSKTRWAMIRRQRQNPALPVPEVLIRNVGAEDLPAIKDIYNYFIRNTVITFDDAPLKLDYWQEKFDMSQKFDLPFFGDGTWVRCSRVCVGLSMETASRLSEGCGELDLSVGTCNWQGPGYEVVYRPVGPLSSRGHKRSHCCDRGSRCSCIDCTP